MERNRSMLNTCREIFIPKSLDMRQSSIKVPLRVKVDAQSGIRICHEVVNKVPLEVRLGEPLNHCRA